MHQTLSEIIHQAASFQTVLSGVPLPLPIKLKVTSILSCRPLLVPTGTTSTNTLLVSSSSRQNGLIFVLIVFESRLGSQNIAGPETGCGAQLTSDS